MGVKEELEEAAAALERSNRELEQEVLAALDAQGGVRDTATMQRSVRLASSMLEAQLQERLRQQGGA